MRTRSFPPPAPSVTYQEQNVVCRLQARDPQALAELYDRYCALVYGIARRIVRDVPAAEDLTQETFLFIWNRIGTFDPARGSLVRWVCLVARSRSLDYLRSAESRMARSAAPLEDARISSAAAMNVERVQLLRDPWNRLRDHERKTLWLAHWLGLSQPEIAARLNRPVGTIKTWMRKGHQSLRASLEGAGVH
jgi:RNA polymerase sigma-70 factor, ECF subfamily